MPKLSPLLLVILLAAPPQGAIRPEAVLGHSYAARALESAGDFDAALQEHQRALAAWDTATPLYSNDWRRAGRSDDPFLPNRDAGEVRRESLAPRIAQLQLSLAHHGGLLLERGRTGLAHGRYDEALTDLQRLLAEFPASPAAGDARELAHRVRLTRALEWPRPRVRTGAKAKR